ncbi:kinesin-like protein KIN-12C [Rutidosis leptorrhynchoides]|uniref:kinesin-like protein KIN-12C n=1 Tax=Rutidosis leptorrhynchoides TaxID=125765 RepID=UPI003A991D33
MMKDSSKSVESEGNENRFEKTVSVPIDIPISRTPLNSIPDPSQFSTEFDVVHSGIRDYKSVEAGSSSNRRKFDSAHSTPARSGSRTTYVGQLGGCTGPRAIPNTGDRGGCGSRVSRRLSSVNCESLPTEVPHFELVEDPSFWNDHNVQVLIRMRPLSTMEKMAQGFGRCLKQESLQTLAWVGHPEVRFTFDHIVCESISQEKLFRVVGLPMVDNCMSGYNSCMFAYGQTGSGKTYTMMGEISQRDGKFVDDCGITPRIFDYLFTRIKLEEENRTDERLVYSCKCSFLEIYNEQITDLLEPSSTNLQLREGLKEGVYVENLTEHNVKTVDDVLKLLSQGAANRKVAETDMNSESSRSHSVFTCIVESRWEKDSVTHLRFGRLNLVDLAGSERQRSSGAGERLKEASYINKSLSTLGLVIMSLVDVANGKHRHVPYRDSKLTFFLQDSLGGNSKTTIIANVSPSMCAANETLSTLKFAQRAKLIQNNAKVNEDASGDVTALQRQIQMLKEQMSLLMKHQKISIPPFQDGQIYVPSFIESFEREGPSGENIGGDFNEQDDQKQKVKIFETPLLGDSSEKKSAGIAFTTVQSHTKQKNLLALPREAAQSTKMLLRFREEKIKRLELLSVGIISTESYITDENIALTEEIQQLQTRIDNNSEVTRFQNSYESGEREALLAEVMALHEQLLRTLEVEESYIERNYQTERENEDGKATMELEGYKNANSKLISKVDELNRELSKYMSYKQTSLNPVENALSIINSGDEMETCDQAKRVLLNNSGFKSDNILDSTNIIQELTDARTLLDTMKTQQAKLVQELNLVRQENQMLVETLSNKNKAETHPMLNHESRFTDNGLSENQSMMDLQARLDKMTIDLEDLKLLNDPLRHEEVENEATNAILNLQEELASLQVKYHRRLCTMSEENNKLKTIIAAKEDEVYTLHSDWERASLELTSFLLDGSKSLKDASGQIESIACSFPRYNVLVGEHVKKAVSVFIEKEQTILGLEKNLVDAQGTIQQMQEKLNSLRSATIALTEEHNRRTEETNKMDEVPKGEVLLKACTNQMQDKQLLVVNQIIAELVAIHNKLDNMKTYLSSLFEDLDGFETDLSTSSSSLSDIEDVSENILVEGSNYPSRNQDLNKQDSDVKGFINGSKAYMLLKNQFDMAYEAFIKLDIQLATVFNDKEYGYQSNDFKRLQNPETTKFVEDKTCKVGRFINKCEEAHATMSEADYMLSALLRANEEGKVLSGKWKQAAEEVMEDNASLNEEINQLKSELQLRNDEHRDSLVELSNLVSVLEDSFQLMQTEAENLCHVMYSDAMEMVQGIHHCICQSRSSLQVICAETMEKSFESIVIQQCRIGEYLNKFGFHEGIMEHVEKFRSMNNGEDELGANSDGLIGENLKLVKELERKNTLLNGVLFDFSLLQESTSTRKDIEDEAEKLLSALSQVQHELKMKTDQLDDVMIKYEKLESRLVDTEAALSASKTCLQHSEETVDAMSYQIAELRNLLEDVYLKKSETEKQLEVQKENVKALENEIHCASSSAQEQFLFSLEGITDDFKRVSSERDGLCEQIKSLQDKLEMAYAIADENEAIAVEARQESEASKIYAEQKEEEVKILENSVEELDSTINVLEKRVNEMEVELERHHKIRDSLELELHSLGKRLLTVESFKKSADNYNADQSEDQISRKLHSRYLELQEAHARIKDLEDERVEQANEIKQCKDYISELLIHAEAQAVQYQQKYKSLEAMVSEMKIESTKSGSEAPISDKTEKSLVRPRGSSSPFRCIGNLVQQVTTEKDHELALAKLRLEELEALASSRQKEVCMLNTKLAAAENMTHDVIRDLLGVKLDMTNYANLINHKQLQRFIEDAAQQAQEFVAMEQEIRRLKRQIDDLLEERDRCISEINSKEAEILDSKMKVVQLQGRDQLLKAQNEMLKADKTNLQKRAAELDDMIKKLLGKQHTLVQSQQQENNHMSNASTSEFGKRLANSEMMLLCVNDELAQYRKPDSPRLHHRQYRKENGK